MPATCCPRVLFTLAVLALSTAPVGLRAQSSAFGGQGFAVYSTERRDAVPAWLELPRTARISTGDGLTFTPLHNAAVSFENLRIGVLVGALRNTGACAAQLSVRLQYVDANWQPMGEPIQNEARVSQVAHDGILPYRFRLRTIEDAPTPPAAYVVIIEQDDAPMADPFHWNRWVSSTPKTPVTTPCPPSDTRVEADVHRRQPLRAGFLIEGTTTLVEGGPVRGDGIVLTAVLRDAKHDVLEVLVGTPRLRGRETTLAAGAAVPFRLHTDMPLGREVAHVDVMVELLPDARVTGTVPP